MYIAIRAGHNPGSPGASGLIDETHEARKLVAAIIPILEKQGNKVLNVTPPHNMNENDDLSYGVSLANENNVDLFISVHFNNAYKSYIGELGTESYIIAKGGNAEIYANRINDQLKTIFKNRGVKIKNFYELRNTKAPAVLIEVCFVEATEDINIYKKYGINYIAKLITQGITGYNINDDNHNSNDTNSIKIYYKVDKTLNVEFIKVDF